MFLDSHKMYQNAKMRLWFYFYQIVTVTSAFYVHWFYITKVKGIIFAGNWEFTNFTKKLSANWMHIGT